MNDSRPSSARITLFAVVVFLIAIGSAAYLYLTRGEAAPAPDRSASLSDDATRKAIGELRRDAYVAFRDMTPGPNHGHLSFTPLANRATRVTTALPCNRLYFTAALGLCLTISRDPAGFRGYLIDNVPDVKQVLDLPGMPSRTRISRDSRFAAFTVFVAGDSYLASGLSTRSRIVETPSGKDVADLESFAVIRDGKEIYAVDFNFWGVTFTHDSNRIYATLGTGGRILLVAGDVAERTFHVVAEDIECPSLSPDETHIAFKKRFGSGFNAWWQPAVLNIATKEVKLLPEPKHIDDQIEWLDDGHILYAVGHSTSAALRRSDVWLLAIDGASPPSLFIPDAESPAVVRP
jgi:hypothetical protein